MPPRPTAGRRALEALLQGELTKAEGCDLVLVDAVYEGSDADSEFTVRVGGGQRRVRVTNQDSPLGVVEAWHEHRSRSGRGEGAVLVVTGTVPADQLGWDLRAHAVGRRPLAVDRAEIVKQLFGVADLDTRMVGESWLLDALLEAEPLDGWPRGGAVLTRDRALCALLAVRLGLGDIQADALDTDADTLFAWTRTPGGPTRFAALPGAERAGLSDWLAQAIGPAAPTLLALAAGGRGADALPLGALAARALSSPAAEAASFGLGTLFGSALDSFEALRPFAAAASGVLARWIAQAEGGGPQREENRRRVLDVLERADALAAEVRLTPLVGLDGLLPSGYRGRLRALAATLDGPAAQASRALEELIEHQLSFLHVESTEKASAAVRLRRWLEEPLPEADSVAEAVSAHLAQTAWVDLAMTVLAEGDDSRDTTVGEAYHRLIGAARARRRRVDERFVPLLAVWAEHASQQAPGGALLIEDVLARTVAPLALDGGRPLVLVLDGMSVDVAVQLAGELDPRIWTEIVPRSERGESHLRQAAVSMLPSLTKISRTSLLCGRRAEGGQSVEQAGFSAFWKKRRRGARLFHKGDYEGAPGHRLDPALQEALASEDVVAVVLNTIDDALDDGREGARARWGIRDVAKLQDLLNAARDHGRPVVLVSDHGHVLDRTPRDHQQPAVTGVGGARWRVGPAREGEVELTGPRVLAGDGRVTAAWREDLRYTARQAGYHGGASLAEVTVPVITVVPSSVDVPAGWTLVPLEQVAPAWWRGDGVSARDVVVGAGPSGGAELAAVDEMTASAPAQEGSSQATAAHSGAVTRGQQVIQSSIYRAQREFVRLAPQDKAVAAALDALLAAGGRLSPAAVAASAEAATGKSQRNPERFATILERLLNVDAYPVLQLAEAGRVVNLDKELLEQQFLSAPSTEAAGEVDA